MEPARNIELKARLHDLSAARETALRLATEYLGVQQQTDTYFHCPQGRLKLREIVDLDSDPEPARSTATEPSRRTAELIAYDRPDQPDAKASDYQRIEIPTAARCLELKTQMGILTTVVKRREIFLYQNVRIHLDEVEKLGTFLEFEAVLGRKVKAPAGRAQVSYLQSEFGIAADDLISCSYSDMLLESAGKIQGG